MKKVSIITLLLCLTTVSNAQLLRLAKTAAYAATNSAIHLIRNQTDYGTRYTQPMLREMTPTLPAIPTQAWQFHKQSQVQMILPKRAGVDSLPVVLRAWSNLSADQLFISCFSNMYDKDSARLQLDRIHSSNDTCVKKEERFLWLKILAYNKLNDSNSVEALLHRVELINLEEEEIDYTIAIQKVFAACISEKMRIIRKQERH